MNRKDYDKKIVEIVEKFGDVMNILEKIVNDLDNHQPVFFSPKNSTTPSFPHIQNIFTSFTSLFKQLDLKYNSLRDTMFQYLKEDEYYLVPKELAEHEIKKFIGNSDEWEG
jgi:hypothetical protein